MASMSSQKTEIKCIKTITSHELPQNKRLKILGLLTNSEYFYYPPVKAAHARILLFAKKRSEIITFDDLLEDPAIEKDFRDILSNADTIRICQSNKEIRHMVGTLEKYRKIRAIYEAASKAINSLNADKFDEDSIIDTLAGDVTKARQITSEEEEMCIIGKDGNSYGLIKEVLYSKAPKLLKTGFDEYDELNGGLPTEGVMIIAATTSGGKSTMLLNLLINLYRINKISVSKVTFEMSKNQETNRFLSNLSGIHYKKFTRGLLSPREKREAEHAHDLFFKYGSKHGCRFATISPERGMTIDDVFITMKPYGFKVIGVDYISLLKGVDSDNQWKIMGNICAQAKSYSRANHCLVILLAQLDDETSKVRYSNGMKENCDVLWKWNYSKEETRETRTLDIRADKVRDGELCTFPLREMFEIMTIDNMGDDYNVDDSDIQDEDLADMGSGLN